MIKMTMLKLTVLKMTKIKFEFISEPDMCIFFEKGKNGGTSYISNNRYRKANNKWLKSYDTKQESSYDILRGEQFR